MSIFKCKMCGGDLEITEGVSVCECEYCGTKQTVPSADNEKKITLFSRANRLRFNNEFDKAAGVYESIVAEFPEESEAYWGLVLCKYGIEYVDDPATSKKIPTCHRSSFESVMDDSNYEQTLENADALARGVYREEAKQIEELRKGIIEVSSKEEPYDIFICYKETAENSDRTIDSVIAQDVYNALTEKGYRVFFSRISLEDKLGVEYEPYIFAALNSAKVMLAFGTDYEYYNAVWVKNEWSRFLQLIAKGEKKTLIPCYKGIDAYDMPKEFAKLQAQDMGKVGAIQDLLRGIEKILTPQQSTKQNSTITGNVTVDTLLERAYILLRDGNFDNASQYFDKVLDRAPKESQAYWGKLLCDQACIDNNDMVANKKIEELYNCCISGSTHSTYGNKSGLDLNDEDIVSQLILLFNPFYKNAIEFASEPEKTIYVSCFNTIKSALLEKLHTEQKRKQIEEQRLAQEKSLLKKRKIVSSFLNVVLLVIFSLIIFASPSIRKLGINGFDSVPDYFKVQLIFLLFSIVIGLCGRYGNTLWAAIPTAILFITFDILSLVWYWQLESSKYQFGSGLATVFTAIVGILIGVACGGIVSAISAKKPI